MSRAPGADPVRRRLLIGGALALCWRAVPAQQALAVPRPAPLRDAYGERPIRFDGVRLELPALAENGNSVPVAIDVDGPMTADDHVARIAVFAPANPVPRLIAFELMPAGGVAWIETRIRLADSQRVWAVAERGDGTLQAAVADVTVTLAACLDTFG